MSCADLMQRFFRNNFPHAAAATEVEGLAAATEVDGLAAATTEVDGAVGCSECFDTSAATTPDPSAQEQQKLPEPDAEAPEYCFSPVRRPLVHEFSVAF